MVCSRRVGVGGSEEEAESDEVEREEAMEERDPTSGGSGGFTDDGGQLLSVAWSLYLNPIPSTLFWTTWKQF